MSETLDIEKIQSQIETRGFSNLEFNGLHVVIYYIFRDKTSLIIQDKLFGYFELLEPPFTIQKLNKALNELLIRNII
jgi:predicted acetyltransferase